MSITPLAVLTFGLPMLAWGALAVAVPVLIHLVLRQRPRRETLPTLRFLLQAHQASTRAHRLKHLVLLACRMTAILLVVGLLMKTGCAPPGAVHPGAAAPVDGPVSAAIVIDDSASMQYRYQGRTRLEDAQAWARSLIKDAERFPPGSELTVLTGSMNPARPAGWSRDPAALARLVADIQPAWHDRPAAALLRQAYAALAEAGHPRREVYLFTDLTESSWQEPPPEPPKGLAAVFILDTGRNEDRNLALARPEVPENLIGENQPVAVQVRVRSGQSASPGTVTLSIDGRPRDRRPVTSEPPPSPSEEKPPRSASKEKLARSASEGSSEPPPSASEGTLARSASEGTPARSASEGALARSASEGSSEPLPSASEGRPLRFPIETESSAANRFSTASHGLPPHSETTLTFTVPSLPEGPHELLFQLEPDDALSFDNRRFACVCVGRVPGAVIVGPDDGGSVATLIAAMIAPPALPDEEQRFSIQRIAGPALSVTRLERPLAVILADPPALTAGGWHTLERYVAAGGTLVIVPGPNTAPETYTGQNKLLPAEIRGTSTPPEPITLAAADLAHPYLKPFTDTGVDSINDRLVYRRLELGPLRAGATVIAPFSDRSPAILENRVGRGRVVQFAFSPDRDWSQFGTQAGPLIVLLHSMLESLSPRPDNIDSLTAGRLATRRWPTAADYVVQPPEGVPVPLFTSDVTTILPTDRPGHYRVFAGNPATQPALLYSVNVAERESDLARVTDEALSSRFPPALALIVHDPDSLPSRRAATGGAVSWTVPLALILLALLFIESFFANRFYGRSPAPEAHQHPSIIRG